MNVLDLIQMQGMLFLMIIIGAVLRKRGVIDEHGKRCLTDLCVNIVIPCNIIKSFLIELDPSVLRACGVLLVVATGLQLLCLVLNRVLFNRYEGAQKKVLQYCTIVSAGGFLGNPVTEGIYGSMGLLYTSIFLIPMRVIMWSVGTSYFVAEDTDRKKVLKNIATHPCLVAVYVGMALMIFQVKLPLLITGTIGGIASCNTALIMFIIGSIMSDVDIRTIANATTIKFSIFRLVLLPALAFALCTMGGLDSVATGVAVLLTGMPAGSTAAIFAARYESDPQFATKCVVFSTLLSMVTLPIWGYIVGG